MYNVLLITSILLKERCDIDNGRSDRYLEIASKLKEKLKTDFVDPEGFLFAYFAVYTDGSKEWVSFKEGVDYWEYGWAVSLGPFYPVPVL